LVEEGSGSVEVMLREDMVAVRRGLEVESMNWRRAGGMEGWERERDRWRERIRGKGSMRAAGQSMPQALDAASCIAVGWEES
jgi:hypothetical protein